MSRKFVRSSTWLIVVTAILILTLNTFLVVRSLDTVVEESDRLQFTTMEALVSSSVLSAGSRGLGRAELIANLPEVVDAFQKQDRPRLLQLIEPIFKVQKAKYGMDRASFYLTPGTMFLRAHAPERFGDDVRSERQLIAQANQRQENMSGVEIGKAGVALYAVSPIRAAGTHLGVFEVGLDFGPILKSLKTNFGFELTLLIDQKLLREKATLMDPAILGPDNLIGDYVNYYSTNWSLTKEGLDVEGLATIRETLTYTKTMNQATFGVLVAPLFDFSGKDIGRVVAIQDIQSSRAQSKSVLTNQILACLFSVVVLFGVVVVSIRGLLATPLKELTGRTVAMVRGDEASPPNPGDYVAELQPLVELHTELRKAAETARERTSESPSEKT